MRIFNVTLPKEAFKVAVVSVLFATAPLSLAGQVAINFNGAQPHPSAMLDIQSTNKGILIPRMNAQQRMAIQSPANGLMVYDTDSSRVMVSTSTGWVSFVGMFPGEQNRIADMDKDTWVDTYYSHSDGDFIVFNLGDTGSGGTGTPGMILRKNASAQARLEFPNTIHNTFIGESTGENTTSGNFNSALGFNALNKNTEGWQNTALGSDALYNNLTGYRNTALGFKSMVSNETGLYNTACGVLSLYTNEAGNGNTTIGSNTLYNNTTGSGGTALGGNALFSNTTGDYNTAVGFDAMRKNETGLGNVAVGRAALYNALLSNQVAVGDSALFTNKYGVGNTAVGNATLLKNYDGRYNTAMGDNALYANESGSANVAFGSDALSANKMGSNNTAVGEATLIRNNGKYNTAIGSSALLLNTDGLYNTAVGADALSFNVSGQYNTAVGTNALLNNTGSYNTALGYYANVGVSSTITKATAIGYNAVVGCSNCMVLGGTGPDAAVHVGIGVSTPTHQLQLSEDDAAKPGGGSWISPSDERLKTNIESFSEGLNIIRNIHPVWFEYNGAAGLPTKQRFVGTIAQELSKVAPYMISNWNHLDANGKKEAYLATNYSALNFVLVNAVKEQQAQIEQLKAENAQLRQQLNQLQTLEARIQALENQQR